MSFLIVNGWTVPVANDAASYQYDYVGELDSRYNNRPSRARRALKKNWSFTTPKMAQDCADTLEALLKGVGHYYPFDADTWSDSGYPTVGSSFVHQTGGGAHRGAGYLQINGSTTFPVDLPDAKWTVMVWRRDGGGWEQYIVRSDGAKFLDGIRNDALSTTWLTVTLNSVVINDSAVDYDELTIYPAVMCDDFCEEQWGWVDNFTEVSPALTVRVDGDFYDNQIFTCVGDVDEQSSLQGGSSAGWVNNYRVLSFRLQER